MNCEYNRVMEQLSVTEYIKKAFELKNEGNYKQAIELFYKALTIDNESSEIMCEIAGLYSKLKNHDRAIEYYEQALSSDPFNLDIKYNLALVYKSMGNMEKAIAFLDSIYKKNPKIDYLVDLLHCLYVEKRFEEVIDAYKKATLINSGSDGLHYYVGLCYSALSEYKKAEKHFRKAYELNNENLDVKYELAFVLYSTESYDEAESLLMNVLDSRICAKSYFLIGEINFALNQLDKAVNYISIAADIENKNPTYFFELATIYSLKGFFKEAEENFQKSIKLSPNNLSYNYALAYLYYQSTQVQKAKQKISYILSINPQHIDALILQSLIKSDENDIIQANKIIDFVLENTSDNDFAFYVKAILYKKLSWWEKAIESIKKAISIKPKSLEYLSELAIYNYEATLFGDTKEICKKILNIDNKYIFAYIMLGKVAFLNKEYPKALELADIAIQYDKNADEAHFLKAKILRATDVKNMAIDCAKAAITLAPQKTKYYEFVAKCLFDQEKYKEAYHYYNEASSQDALNADYKFYMAKCSQALDEKNNTIANYSVARRLAPSDSKIIDAYAEFLSSIKKHKQAIEIINTALAFNPKSSEKELLQHRLIQIKDKYKIADTPLKKLLNKLKRGN